MSALLRVVGRPNGYVESADFRSDWWRWRMGQTNSELLAVEDDTGDEVARVELIDHQSPGNYRELSGPSDWLKIQFIEVRAGLRCAGVGKVVLQLLADAYPDRRFFAYSEADGFWATTGWSRHIHCDDDPRAPRLQVLFAQPT